MTSINDFKNDDGNVDWSAYKEAQVKAGQICMDCGSYIIFNKTGPAKCYDCKQLEEPGECSSDAFIRCPDCGHKEKVFDGDHYEILSDDTHDVSCQECDHDFEITTSVSYTFSSPEMIAQKENPEKNKD